MIKTFLWIISLFSILQAIQYDSILNATVLSELVSGTKYNVPVEKDVWTLNMWLKLGSVIVTNYPNEAPFLKINSLDNSTTFYIDTD